jgi:flagellar motor switch protein FliN
MSENQNPAGQADSGAQPAPAAPVAPDAAPMQLPDLSASTTTGASGSIDMLMDVDLEVKIELGRTDMPIEDVLRLKKGSVVELDKLAGDPVDILVNDRPVARGEVLVVNDNFCVRVTEILDPEAGLKAGEKNG